MVTSMLRSFRPNIIGGMIGVSLTLLVYYEMFSTSEHSPENKPAGHTLSERSWERGKTAMGDRPQSVQAGIFDKEWLMKDAHKECINGQGIAGLPPICGLKDCLQTLNPESSVRQSYNPIKLTDHTVQELSQLTGFSNPMHIHIINLVTNIQRARGVVGSVGEIGVFTGFLTSILAQHVDTGLGERLFAVDTFEKTDGEADLKYNMIQNKNVFFERIARKGFTTGSTDPAKKLHVWYDTSAYFTKYAFAKMNIPSVRLMSVDGLHYNTIVWHEIINCLCILRQGGILIFDDIVSYKFKTHIVKGISDFFRLISPDVLRPLIVIHNKLYMTTSEWHGRYIKDIRDTLARDFVLQNTTGLRETRLPPGPLKGYSTTLMLEGEFVSRTDIPFFNNFTYFLGPTPFVGRKVDDKDVARMNAHIKNFAQS